MFWYFSIHIYFNLLCFHLYLLHPFFEINFEYHHFHFLNLGFKFHHHLKQSFMRVLDIIYFYLFLFVIILFIIFINSLTWIFIFIYLHFFDAIYISFLSLKKIIIFKDRNIIIFWKIINFFNDNNILDISEK